MSLLRNLKHANIVTLHDLVHTERSLTLVFEYLVSGRGAGAGVGAARASFSEAPSRNGQGLRLRGGSEPGPVPLLGWAPPPGALLARVRVRLGLSQAPCSRTVT